MNRSSKVLLSALIVALMALVAGCGSTGGEKTIASVGDYDITLDEFVDFTSRMTTPYGSAQEEFDNKLLYLDSIITRRLLVQAAYELGIDSLEEVARLVLANKDRFLLDILYWRKVAEGVTVEESEIKAFYEMLEFKMRFSHILVKEKDTADMLVQKLMDGGSFEQLAYDYSIDPSAKRNRGDLGYNLWGALVNEFQEVGFQMEIGEISPPVKSDFGYHIIKVTDKGPNETKKSYERSKPRIKKSLLERKKQSKLFAFMKETQEKYVVNVDTTVCQYVMHKRETLYPPQVLAQLPRADFDLEQLDRNERELVLATWDGGQITLSEYLTDVKRLRMEQRPDLDDIEGLQKLIYQMKINEFLVLEANKFGLENDPTYKRKIKLYKDLTMAEIMENDSLPSPSPVDESSVRVYYDANIDEFTEPAEIQINEILLSDELLANQLAKEIKTLEGFREKAMDLTERPGKRNSNGDLGYIQREWFPEIYDAALEHPVGTLGGPVLNSTGQYSLFWVVDKLAASTKDFLDVKGGIRQKLDDQAKNEALRLWVEERKSKTPIDINQDMIWETIDPDKYEQSEG